MHNGAFYDSILVEGRANNISSDLFIFFYYYYFVRECVYVRRIRVQIRAG